MKDNVLQTEAGKPSGEDEDNQSETGTVFEPYPVGHAHELHALGGSGRTRRLRRRPTRGNSPGLLNRLNMKVSQLLLSRPLLTKVW